MLANPLAIVGVLLIIPIILLYLLKPKPRKILFPTIMFITKMEKDHRFRLFPKRFVRDPLLLIQILAIGFLVLAVASPYIMTSEDKRPEGSIVLVLDASASMKSTDESPSRFEKAKDAARRIIDDSAPGSVFSIILAENMPAVALRGGDGGAAKAVLSRLGCVDTTTNIGDSMLFGKDMLSGIEENNKEMYVFSDFASSQGFDIGLAKTISSKSGIKTRLIKIGGAGKNTAIVDVDAKRFLTNRDKFYMTASIQNYVKTEARITGQIFLDETWIKDIKEVVPANSSKLIYLENSLSTDPHMITVRIDSADDLLLDNIAYASIPGIRKYRVLLITDEKSDSYLESALKSSPDVTLTKAVSPVIPQFSGYDTIIVGEVKKSLLLKGMYTELTKYLDSGGDLVILASDDLGQIDEAELKDMLPVKLDLLRSMELKAEAADHEIFKDTSLTDIILNKYYATEAKDGAEVLATVAGKPLIAYRPYKQGRVVYVGLNPNPAWSNFYYSSSMPIFWFQFIKWVNRDETAATQYNYRTGDYLPAKTILNVTTPSGGRLSSANIILNEAGIYSINGAQKTEKIAVNLLDEQESDIGNSLDVGAIGDGVGAEKEKTDAVYDIYPYLLVMMLVLLLLELVYYKKRGYFQK
jgi:hypothetical protein